MKRWLTDLTGGMLCRFLRPRGSPLNLPENAGNVRAIIVIKLDAIGDFVLVTPFLRELRRLYPRARITLVTRPLVESLARACPWADEVAVLPTDLLPRRFGSFRLILRYTGFHREQLGRRSYDLAIVPRTGPDNHHARLLAYLSGARIRVGFASSVPSIPACTGHTLALAGPVEHEVPANLRLIDALGGSFASDRLELTVSDKERNTLDAFLEGSSFDPVQPFVALGVGASLPHKRWPAARYAELAAWIFHALGWRSVVLGDENDRELFDKKRPELLVFAGQLSLPQSWALLRYARVFVGGDSAVMHLAAAATVPSVVILSQRPALSPDAHDPNAFFRFHPYGVPYATVAPVEDRTDNIAAVSLDHVVSVLVNLLSNHPLAGSGQPASL